MFTDIHAHLNHFSLEEIENILEECRAQGVERIITCAYNLKTLKKSLPLLKAFPNIYLALGVHPQDAWGGKAKAEFMALMDKSLPALAAIGEIGYDNFPDNPPLDRQREFFLRQLHLAKSSGLPVILHIRQAFEQLFADIDLVFKKALAKPKLILHSYSGGFKYLEPALKRGCYISLGGALTYERSTRLKRIAALLPLNRILLETDSPFIPPAAIPPVEKSLPQDLSVIFKSLTEVRREAPEIIKVALEDNINNIFDFERLDKNREQWIALLEKNLKDLPSL
jgi:TatD DNase family protein